MRQRGEIQGKYPNSIGQTNAIEKKKIQLPTDFFRQLMPQLLCDLRYFLNEF